MRRIVALSFSLLLLVHAAPTAGAGGAKDGLQGLLWDFQLVPLDGATSPALTLESLDGTPVSLGELRGRPVLVYFWHST
jgi:cytochrome oxidase Cu insertion factor (SCO1/SenC/PrrC family)